MTERTVYQYDVFISYSHRDEDWVVKTLLPRLEAAGLEVCIDFRDFLAGRVALLNMQDAATNSRHTLLVLTPNWVESEYALYEGLLSRTPDPAGLHRRTVPLMLEKCDLPPFLGMVTYVDFTRPEREEIAWRQLLTGLGAAPPQEAPEPPSRAGWLLAHPYPMPPNFTGRLAERQMLTNWLTADAAHPLLVLRALGGFGKSALTWHWLLHDVDPAIWPRLVWWSFYETEASFNSFVAGALEYLQVDIRSLGPRQQVDALLRLLHQPGLLLVLDGFERELRAYRGLGAAYQGDDLPLPEGEGRGEGEISQRDCVSPLAEYFLRRVASLPDLHSKVLMTTRLLPGVLEAHGSLLQGCREVELTQLQPADAVAFCRSQGIRGSRAELERSCEPYGYHPLSLRLLAGLIANDLQQPGDILAARRLDPSGDLVQRRHHVLEQAYNNLTPARQQLLSRIACFRGPVDYDALAAIAQSPIPPSPNPTPLRSGDYSLQSPSSFQHDLHNLLSRGLLHHDHQTNRYDLHPIVRRYAYDRLTDKTAAHARLRDYFAAVPAPEQVQRLEDLAPVIELYHHTVRAGQYDEAIRLYHERLWKTLYYQLGAYQIETELLRALFPDGEEYPPRLENEGDQAWTLNQLANSYSLSGQPRRAVPLYEDYFEISENRGVKVNIAIGLGNLAIQQMAIGALQAAEANLRHSITICREIEDEVWEAVGHRELGRLLAYRGQWAEAEEELTTGLALFEQEQAIQSQGIMWAYRALRALLLARTTDRSSHPGHDPLAEALVAARRAFELAEEFTQTNYPIERDFVRAHWLLGAAHRANSQLAAAESHLTEALTRCRGINAVDTEAEILLDLARLRAAQGAKEEAHQLAQEALLITERCGYVLQDADVNLFLAGMALAAGDQAKALQHAQQARQLATCDGPPDYTYKVAYDEAGALLERLREEG